MVFSYITQHESDFVDILLHKWISFLGFLTDFDRPRNPNLKESLSTVLIEPFLIKWACMRKGIWHEIQVNM